MKIGPLIPAVGQRPTWPFGVSLLGIAWSMSPAGCGGLEAAVDVDSGQTQGVEDVARPDVEASSPLSDANSTSDTNSTELDASNGLRVGMSQDAVSDVPATVADAAMSGDHSADVRSTGADAAADAPPMNDNGVPTCGSASTAYTFDTSTQCWQVTYTSAQQGSVPIPPADVLLSFDPSDGQPAPGSLHLGIPYFAAGQYVGVGVPLTLPIDLTNRVVTARVKLVSGAQSPTDLMNVPAGAKIYVKSGASYVFAAGVYSNITAMGVWIPIAFDPDIPAYIDTTNSALFNPADIREFGIQIDTSGLTTTAQPAVILIDTVAY